MGHDDGGSPDDEDMLAESQQPPSQTRDHTPAQHNYMPGTIKSIKLINFMCHESFELALGPRVNFVIGPNGSGKSALLTAIVVVLGGRATTTSRARRASDFILYGKKYARIICVLHNYSKVMEREKAYKPDDYGKEIIVEKTIYKEDVAKLILKNDRGKKVSERKQELDDMLEHFGILINNPICILNQEISKTFLHSKKPEDKFELFMKATNLEQIQQDYDEAKRLHHDWGDCNHRKTTGFRLLDNELSSCKEKSNFLMNRVKLQALKANLECEYTYAGMRDLKDAKETAEKNIANTQTKIEDNAREIDRREGKISSAQSNIEQIKLKIESCREDCKTSEAKVRDVERKERELKMKRNDVQTVIGSHTRTLDRLREGKRDLEASIKESRRRFEEQNAFNRDAERHKLEMKRLEEEIVSEHAREITLKQHTEQLDRSMTEIRDEWHQSNMKVSGIRNEISGKQAMLRRLKGGQENELRKYGEYMVEICKEVELAYKQKRFKTRPLGPLGRYIKLSSQDCAAALEIHLGRNAHAFVCDNVTDLRTLKTIIRRVQPRVRDFRNPLIITRRFGSRHSATQNKAVHERYKTLLDYVDIDEDPIYNVLVDRTSLESVLFIPDAQEAEHLMITQSLIPRGTKCAYTRDCFVMHPRTANSGFRSIANNYKHCCLFSKGNAAQIREAEREIENLEADLRDAESSAKHLQDSLAAQKLEYESNNKELRTLMERVRKNESKLLELKTTLTAARPEELSSLEVELDECVQKIGRENVNLESAREKLAQIDCELKDVAVEKESAITIRRQREKALQEVTDMIAKENALIRKHREAISQLKLASVQHSKVLEELRKDVDNFTDSLAEMQQTMDPSEQPAQVRATATVLEELRKVKRQLSAEIEENADPHELFERLQKRQKEIEGLMGLKSQNEYNFGLSAKAMKERDEGYKNLCEQATGSVARTFASVTKAMGMSGMLKINTTDSFDSHGNLLSKAKTLEISIDTTPGSQRPPTSGGLSEADENLASQEPERPRNSRTQPIMPRGEEPRPPPSKRPRTEPTTNGNHHQEKENLRMTDTRSLSGGERSFSTVAFVLALWHHCASPFKLMDEIDVFMDMVTRRFSYNALIRFARITDTPGQFIYFSPLELPKIDDSDCLVRVFEMPRIIRRGFANQSASQPAGDEP